MNLHPLDGNMIAADRHYGQGGKQAGDRCQCGGFIEDMADDEADEEQLACTECGAAA